MTTFFPGPSRVFPHVSDFLQEAVDQGIVSITHRGQEFMDLSQRTQELLRQQLKIPQDYTILFTASATESWEIIPQSLVRHQSAHYYNGAFGEKWFQYSQKLRPQSYGHQFGPNEVLEPQALEVPQDAEIICLTQNETSNGTQVTPERVREIAKRFPDRLIALDMTSSMYGIELPFNVGDIWFGSVQKCFGMPAGLGLLVLSPRAVDRAWEIGENKHWNSLTVLLERIKKYQTSCTPNVLGIYTMMRILETYPSAKEHDQLLKERLEQYYQVIEQRSDMKPYIQENEARSRTVITVEMEPEALAEIKQQAENRGMLLGKGYSDLKDTTFRIANFPAIQQEEFEKLLSFLRDY